MSPLNASLVAGLRGRTEVVEVQRSRLIAAMVGAVEAHGYQELTVAEVLVLAKVSRKTFYEIFDDLEDCFLAVFEQTVAHARELVQAAYRSEPDWRSGMRAALLCLLTLLEQERAVGRLCVVDTLAAGQRVLECRVQLLGEIALAIDGGRAVANARHDPHPLTGQAIAGGIATLLHTRLVRQDPAPLTDLHGALMSMIVMPYLGRGVAYMELSAISPPPHRDGRSVLSQRGLDPLARLDMRLTYRTMRVLKAIANAPDAPNSQIADAAGIVDQGQMSRLLARLARLGLVENIRPERLGHGQNAWRLTSDGARLQRAIGEHL
jgi:TetR/AcrR family transcriptional regulator